MCTRMALDIDADTIKHDLATIHDVQIYSWDDSNEFQPKYNIGDMMNVPIVLHRTAPKNPLRQAAGPDAEPAFAMRSSRWRLVPDWYTVEDERRKTLEVSAEELVNNQGFGGIARTQTRCIVVCKGYYSFPRAQKQLPSYVRRQDGHLLLLAGICASANIDGKELHSFAVVTTKVGGGLPGKRQPVLLRSLGDMKMWLTQRGWTASLGDLVSTPHDNTAMPLESYVVPEGVRKPGVESPSFIQPIECRSDGITKAFKGKNKRQAEGSPERTPPPTGSTSRLPPPSSPKKLRLTSPVPSPLKVRITPSKPMRVTQVNRASESPTPVDRHTGTPSSHAYGPDSDDGMYIVQYVASSSEGEGDDGEPVATILDSAEAGPSTLKGKGRERGSGTSGNAGGQTIQSHTASAFAQSWAPNAGPPIIPYDRGAKRQFKGLLKYLAPGQYGRS